MLGPTGAMLVLMSASHLQAAWLGSTRETIDAGSYSAGVSEENLELARQFVELGRCRDPSQLDMLAEDVRYVPIAEVTEAAEYHGRDGFRRYMKGFIESGWVEDLTWEATSYADHGDAVIVRIQFGGKGRVSGLSFDPRVFQVLRFRDGEIISVEDFLRRDDALRAAGAVPNPQDAG
jgi:ketosteroid isomerase-like protein